MEKGKTSIDRLSNDLTNDMSNRARVFFTCIVILRCVEMGEYPAADSETAEQVASTGHLPHTETVSDITVNVSSGGRFAWATSLWDFKATMGGQAIALPVRCTWILEKREIGWVVVHFHKSVGTA